MCNRNPVEPSRRYVQARDRCMSLKATIFIFAYLVLSTAVKGAEDNDDVVYPGTVFACLRNPAAADLSVTTDRAMYYLRGDFDGDGKADYAVAVRGKKTKRRGVLICDGLGRIFVLGADTPTQPPFSDVEEDNFVAPNWLVYSRAETKALGNLPCCVPHPVPRTTGETIGMVWENGTGLIYWDGHRYRWAGFK